MAKQDNKLSTKSYRGVRDFYPEDQFIQRYIFEHMEQICELFGYEEYSSSILESAELYRGKTSEEIVNEQTYTFTDRGEREVTLRPEVTPSFARMIAARYREIPFPARWYTIANCFRYERPQRGRLREHWQLNADIVGAEGAAADAEIIAIAHGVMRSLGADERNFEIHVSDRRILDAMYGVVGIEKAMYPDITRLLDRRDKIKDFEKQLSEKLGSSAQATKLVKELARTTSTAYLEELRGQLELLGVGNIPAVGFAMGDVTARDFLETHNLLPKYAPSTELMLLIVEADASTHAMRLAQELRREDVTVSVNFSGKRVGDQIRQADKMKVPFIIAIGTKERESGRYTVKNISTGAEITLTADRIAEHLFSSLG